MTASSLGVTPAFCERAGGALREVHASGRGGCQLASAPPSVLSCVVYVRLATDERHTGRVGIVAIGVPSVASSSMDALG